MLRQLPRNHQWRAPRLGGLLLSAATRNVSGSGNESKASRWGYCLGGAFTDSTESRNSDEHTMYKLKFNVSVRLRLRARHSAMSTSSSRVGTILPSPRCCLQEHSREQLAEVRVRRLPRSRTRRAMQHPREAVAAALQAGGDVPHASPASFRSSRSSGSRW